MGSSVARAYEAHHCKNLTKGFPCEVRNLISISLSQVSIMR